MFSSELEWEIKRSIMKALLENSTIDKKIEEKIKEGIEYALRYDDPDDDHVKPPPASDAYFWGTLHPDFPPLSEITKSRRKAYAALGIDLLSIANNMKERAVESTEVTKAVTVSKRLHINIKNKSPLLMYLASGWDGSLSKKTENEVRREIIWIKSKAKELGVDKDEDIVEYLSFLSALMYGEMTLSKIPIRDVLRASAETIGKDFIKTNIVK